MQQETPTIVIVDDASEVRVMLKTRLRLSGRLTVVGEGADGSEAVELAREHQPALMLLDVSMPGHRRARGAATGAGGLAARHAW